MRKVKHPLRFLQTESINILSNLVKIRSENPPGNERDVSEFIVKYLGKFGINSKKVITGSERVNIVATLEGIRRSPTVLLVTHTDTKPAYNDSHQSWRYGPFSARISNGRLFGRGASDSKGSLAAMMTALVLCSKVQGRRGNVKLLAVADEEANGKYGMKSLLDRNIVTGDIAIIGEPTDMQVCVAQLGVLWVHFRIFSTGGHAGLASPKTNPLRLGIILVKEIERFIESQRKLFLNPFYKSLQGIGLNVIRCGTVPGTAPDFCELIIDIRILPGQNFHKLLRGICDLSHRFAARHAIKIDALKFHDALNPITVDTSNMMVSSVIKTAQQSIGNRTKIKGFYGGSDAHYLMNEANIPSIILGPGSLKDSHIPNEYVKITDVRMAAKVYYRMIGMLVF